MFQAYFKSIQLLFLTDDESSEMTFRSSLENFLREFEKAYVKRELTIKQEPINLQGIGRPDFKITTKEQLTIGLLETKKIGEDLKKILNSKQLENYQKLSENIIVTDYLHFYLIHKGEPVFDCSLFSDYNLQNKRFKVEQTRIDELTKLLKTFFESEPEPIVKTEDLAFKLSEKAIFLKDYCINELNIPKEEPGKLEGLYEVFKITLLPSLKKEYFADIYAQTLTYGLFLAALNCNDPKKELNKNTAYSLLPSSFQLIKELFHNLEDFPNEIIWYIDLIINILRVTDFIAIKKEFAEYRHREKGFNDPFIFFYEDFLKHYDKKQRELRGVYYTPEPVVSFIVRSIEVILKDFFHISDGLLSNLVTLLDFATGTGTFLLYTFKLALEQALQVTDKKTVNKILNEQLINNFYGFELLVAPYVIAHLKISEYLKEQGYQLDNDKRLNIFLTDTLTNEKPHSFPTMQSLTKEGKEADRIKNKDILVILGNPPYSIHSMNKSDFILKLLKDYKPKDERKLNIDDDYIKFIRFAHWKMEKLDRGIVGIVSNNSYLSGITHRKMRTNLINSFNKIYIINLHGDYLENEFTNAVRNVFDITIGVCISIFIKDMQNKNNNCEVFYKDIFGLRTIKYSYLFENDIRTETFEKVDYTGFNNRFNQLKWKKRFIDDINFFVPLRNLDNIEQYGNFWGISEIFNKHSVGIKTKVDKISINFDKMKLAYTITDILKNQYKKSELITKYKIRENTTWEYKRALKAKYEPDKITYYDYRPFDKRFLFYDNNFLSRSRQEIMEQFYNKSNIGLEVARLDDFVSFISENISDEHFCGGSSYKFPLFTFNNHNNNNSNNNGFLFNDYGKKDNFRKEFRQFFKSKYFGNYSPENILGYIYAILHSPTYRTKYNEFLKIDFPRIPFTDNEKLFKELSAIGYELIQNHLLKKDYENKNCKFLGDSDNYRVEQVYYNEKEQKVWINKDRYFQPVLSEIWNFHIGGYQVLDKWLKERKKHEITLEWADIEHFMKIIDVLNFTTRTMQKIDDLTNEWI